MSEHKPHKRPVTKEGIALLIEDCERTSAALSMRPTPFQLEQAVNFLVATVPAALRNLEEQLRTEQREHEEMTAQFVNAAIHLTRAEDRIKELQEQLESAQSDNARWLAWSGGQYPDDSPGDVIHAHTDGTIILDDGITTWNPLRALRWLKATPIAKTTAAVASSESSPAKERDA